jgi:CRP-like cAMP-binding protein
MQNEAHGVDPAAESPLFGTLSSQVRGELLACGTLRGFTEGDVLFDEGDPAGFALFLLSGSLQMAKTAARGRKQIMCDMRTAVCSGICLSAMGDRALSGARATSDGEVLVVQRTELERIAFSDPTLYEGAWSGAVECMEHLSGLVEHLSFRKVAERVCLALMENTSKDGDLVRWTQSDLAAQVGTTREVVARCLAGLQTAGAVRLGRGRITVLSRAKLLKQCQ